MYIYILFAVVRVIGLISQTRLGDMTSLSKNTDNKKAILRERESHDFTRHHYSTGYQDNVNGLEGFFCPAPSAQRCLYRKMSGDFAAFSAT